MTDTKRPAHYARVSDPKQKEQVKKRGNRKVLEEKSSIQNQLEKCRAYSAEHGFVVSAEFEFMDVMTGSSLDRPNFDRLKAFVATGAVNVVIFHVQDRMSRADVLDTVNLLWQFREAGAEIHFTDMGLVDFNNPIHMLEIMLKANAAFEERKKIKRRATDAVAKMLDNDKLLVPSIPKFGFDISEDDEYIINEDEAQWVRTIFDWYTIGDDTGPRLGLLAIARKLTELSVPTKFDRMGKSRRKTKVGTWSSGSVHHIIGDEIYTGVKWQNQYCHGGKLKDRSDWRAHSVPQIIERDQWETAQRIARDNQFNNAGGSKYFSLLRGHIVCAKCGTRVATRRDSRNGRLLYCCYGQQAGYAPDGLHPTCGGAFDLPALDEAAWNAIKKVLKEPEKIAAGLIRQEEDREAQIKPDRDYLERTKAELAKLDDERARYMDLYANPRWKPEQVDEKVDATDRERQIRLDKIKELETRLAASPVVDAQTVETFRQVCKRISKGIDYFTQEEQRAAIEVLDVRATIRRGDPVKNGQKRQGTGTMSLSAIVPLGTVDLSAANLSQTGWRLGNVQSIPFTLIIQLAA